MVGFNPTWAPGATQILLSGRGLYNGSFWGGFFGETLRGQVTQLRTDPKFIPADDIVQFSGDARDPAADIWLRAWREDNRRSYWLPRAHRILVASFSIDGPPYFWQSLDTMTGGSSSLPFPAFSQLAMSPTGSLAGIIPSCLVALGHGKPGCAPKTFKSAWGTERVASGPIYVESPDRPRRLARVGWGYDPVWSSDGQWLYFVSRSSYRSVRFRMQFGGSTPYWAVVESALYHSRIYRVRADGSRRQLITSADNYGFADLNVLHNGAVVYTAIPSDRNLWRHRKLGLTQLRAGAYVPVPSIEEVVRGKGPVILLHDAYSPAVQP
jgi:hypothetical protein